MTRVLYVVNNLGVGGAEHVLLGLASGLDRSMYDPTVVSVGPNLALAPKFVAAGVPVICLNTKVKADPRGYVRLVRLVRELAPDILHGFLWRSNMFCRYAGRRCRVPTVVTSEHSMRVDGPIREWINRRTAAGSSAVVCVSRAVLRHMRDSVGIPERLLRVIYNGVDLSRFAPCADKRSARDSLGLPPDGPVIGTVARHTEEKRIDRFVEMARLIGKVLPEASFITAGEGPKLAWLTDLARRRDAKVRFLGYRDDVPLVLGALDVFVLTSQTEGLPMAVIEAMAVELPIVSMLVGGVAEMVRNGQDGVLVKQGDIRAVADGVLDLLQSRETRARMGRSARRRVMSLVSLDAVVAKHERLYEELLGARVDACPSE